MRTGYLSTMDKSDIDSHQITTNTTLGRIAYRFSLVIFGLLWVFLSSTLCGCGSMNGYVMNRSGRRYYDKGNYEYARYEFERALMDDPHNANYAFNVARTMEKEGEGENAEMMYQHALTLNPNHQPSYHSLASMLRDEGREGEARDLLTAWADTQPYSSGAQMSAANMYQQEGNQAAAQQHYSQAMRDMKPGRQQRRAAQHYPPQQQMAAYRGPQQMQSVRYPYGTPPSMQMATVMPQQDPTMMGGPVIAPRAMAATPVYQQPTPAGPTWTPTQGVPTPQQYIPPNVPGGEPQLLPELPAPTSSTNPSAYYPQEFISQQHQPVPTAAPQFGTSPYAAPPQPQYLPSQQQVMLPAAPVQYGTQMPVQQAANGTPFQNISTQTTANIVPAVQAF